MTDPYFSPHPYRNQNNNNANVALNYLNRDGNIINMGEYNQKYTIHADLIAVKDIATIGLSLSVGEGSKTRDNNTIALGEYTCACSKNAIAIGSHVSATHENSVVIGSNISSKNDDSVMINDVEFTKGKISCGDSVNIVYNGVNIQCTNSCCEGECTCENLKCGGCDNPIVRGITWTRDGYTKDQIEYDDTKLGLCFDCIFDCVIEFKAKQSWELQKRNFGVVDPLDKIRADIKELQKHIL